MREKNGIEYVQCVDCGFEFPIDMMDDCIECFDGPFCPSCLDDHEDMEHLNRCAECEKELDDDPPCPICKAELCDDCFGKHVKECKWQHELGKAQRLLTQFPPFKLLEWSEI